MFHFDLCFDDIFCFLFILLMSLCQACQQHERLAIDAQGTLQKVVEDRERSEKETEDMVICLRNRLEEATEALQTAIDQREGFGLALDRTRQEIIKLQDWADRAARAISVLGMAFACLSDKYKNVCSQKRHLATQCVLSTSLSTNVYQLALAVSGGVPLSSSASVKMGGGAKHLSLRAVVVAVLFANRLGPHFRSRLKNANVQLQVLPPQYDNQMSLATAGSLLPSTEELAAVGSQKAPFLLLRRLESLDKLGSTEDVVGDQHESLLSALGRGARSFARMVRKKQGNHGPRDINTLDRWDPSGEVAMGNIRKGFLVMAHSLTDCGEKLVELKRENEWLADALQKHKEESSKREEHFGVLSKRLEAFEAEKAGLLGDAKNSGKSMCIDRDDEGKNIDRDDKSGLFFFSRFALYHLIVQSHNCRIVFLKL